MRSRVLAPANWCGHPPRQGGQRSAHCQKCCSDGGPPKVRSEARPGLRADSYRFARTFRRRIGGYLALAILIGLVGGLSLGAIAGARRTASSFPTYVASTNPSTLNEFAGLDNPTLGLTSGYDPTMLQTLAHLPHVVASAVSVGFDGNIDLTSVAGIHAHYTTGETPPTVVGGLQGEYLTQDRVTLVNGRMAEPRRTDEAVMDAQAAKEWGLHLGSVITMPFYSDAESNSPTYNGPPYRLVTVRMVGEVVMANTVVQDDISALGSATVILTPALTRQLASAAPTTGAPDWLWRAALGRWPGCQLRSTASTPWRRRASGRVAR